MPPLDSAVGENHIPDAIRRQSERADEIAREIGVAGVEPLEEPPVADEPVIEPAVEPQPAPPLEPLTDWEQRYRTLQGKYDSEVPTLRGRVTSMERLLAEMNTPPAPAASAPSTTTTVVIPSEDSEAYGDDLIAAARRWARAEVQSELNQLRTEMNEIRGGQRELTAVTANQRVLAALDADTDLPNWRQINDDPLFIDWLNQTDPFSGEVRMALLQNAFANGNSIRCSHFFKTFIAEHTATTRLPTSTPPQTPPPEEAGRPTLESLAAPGRAAGTGPTGGAPAEKRVWTRPEITAFYRDAAAGKYAHREADKHRLEADIIAAASEGRIR